MWDLFIVTPLTNLLLWIYGLSGNSFGLAIILFTILIRLVTWPLTAQQLKGAQAMQELQKDKEWQAIQKKYAKDREKLAQEQMRLYKERGINPFGSCLPTLIQFPILIGLYQSLIRALANTPYGLLALGRSIYPFLNAAALIPLNNRFLWMDLGRPESIPITIGGTSFGLPSLAIIVALTTYLQSKLTMPPSPANPDDPTAAQAAAMGKMMSIYMPLLLGYFALTFPSGLSVYFIVSNILGIIQYAMMGKVDWHSLLPRSGQKKK